MRELCKLQQRKPSFVTSLGVMISQQVFENRLRGTDKANSRRLAVPILVSTHCHLSILLMKTNMANIVGTRGICQMYHPGLAYVPQTLRSSHTNFKNGASF